MKISFLRLFSCLLIALTATSADAPSLPLDKGGIVLTFDDRNFDYWIEALPLFDKYGVKATFFISGKIDEKTLKTALELKRHGHAIGSHSVNHVRAVEYFSKHTAEEYLQGEIMPQLDVFKAAGIEVTSFAYPMSNNNDATDEALLKVFRHLRTGKGTDSQKMISDYDCFFHPVEDTAKHGLLYGKGIDFAPVRKDRTYEKIEDAFVRAVKNNEIVTLYAHRIATISKGNHITPAALEHIFKTAKKLNLPFYTVDQLP